MLPEAGHHLRATRHRSTCRHRPGGRPGSPAGPQGALSARRQGAEPRGVIRPAAPSARSARLRGWRDLARPPHRPHNRCLHQPSPWHSPPGSSLGPFMLMSGLENTDRGCRRNLRLNVDQPRPLKVRPSRLISRPRKPFLTATNPHRVPALDRLIHRVRAQSVAGDFSGRNASGSKSPIRCPKLRLRPLRYRLVQAGFVVGPPVFARNPVFFSARTGLLGGTRSLAFGYACSIRPFPHSRVAPARFLHPWPRSGAGLARFLDFR